MRGMEAFDDDEDDLVRVEVLPEKRTAAEERALALRNLEDELLQESMKVVRDVLRFRDVDPTEEEPPMSWRLEHGYDEAKKMQAIARAAWMPAKLAPVGLKYATQMGLGIIKARATERAAPQNLAVQFIQMTVPPRQFPEIVIKEEDP